MSSASVPVAAAANSNIGVPAVASAASASAPNDTLPLARVKKFIKLDPDVKVVNQKAVKLIARATELFVGYMARKSFERTMVEKRKTVQYQDCSAAVQEYDTLEFLTDIVPHKVHLKEKDTAAAKRARKAAAADDDDE